MAGLQGNPQQAWESNEEFEVANCGGSPLLKSGLT
jgi:hypothetical protein